MSPWWSMPPQWGLALVVDFHRGIEVCDQNICGAFGFLFSRPQRRRRLGEEQ